MDGADGGEEERISGDWGCEEGKVFIGVTALRKETTNI